MPRILVPLLSLLVLLGALAPGAGAQDPVPVPSPTPTPTPAPEPRIRTGVTVSGVDVGDLTLAEAQAKLEQELGPLLARDVEVVAARKHFTLSMKALGFTFRADRTAQRAYNAGTAAPPAADGTLPPASATPSVSYKRDPVWSFAKDAAKKLDRAPRDARVRILLTHIIKKPGRKGRKLLVRPLVKAIEKTVEDPLAKRTIRPGTKRLVPDMRTKELKRVYRTIITIDRDAFRLRLFKKLHIAKRYGVAVGMPAYPTPTGLFHIQSKQVNPTWTAPNSPWAGELAGQSFSGNDPNNPLKARWMGVSGSVGIHGTGQEYSIGSRASHGCIRMTVPDVIDLFKRVPLGTPVLIK